MNLKKLLPSIIVGLILAGAGFFIGRDIGLAEGYKEGQENYKFEDVEKIREDIKMIERKNLIVFLEAKAGIVTKKEGKIFNKHQEAYFSGVINNKAAWTIADSIRLQIDFYSEDNIMISSDTLDLAKSIIPGKSFKFREKIQAPETYNTFNFTIVSAVSK